MTTAVSTHMNFSHTCSPDAFVCFNTRYIALRSCVYGLRCALILLSPWMILIREAKFILAYWRRALLRSFFFAPFLVYRIMQHPELIKTVRNDTPGKPESFNVSRKHSPGKRCVSFRRVKGERHQALSFGQARTRGNVLERNAGATRIVYPHCVVASPVTAPAASFFSAPGSE